MTDPLAVFEAAIPVAAQSAGEVHARQIRVRALRFLAHCRATGLDPLAVSQEQWDAYVRDTGWPPARVAKEQSAVHQVLRAAGQLEDEHGLGTGDQSWRLRSLAGTPADDLVQQFLAERYPSRVAVARSALAKLKTWADEVALPLDGITGPDIEDFDYWLRSVGGQREVMVVVRKWVNFLAERHRARPGNEMAVSPLPAWLASAKAKPDTRDRG